MSLHFRTTLTIYVRNAHFSFLCKHDEVLNACLMCINKKESLRIIFPTLESLQNRCSQDLCTSGIKRTNRSKGLTTHTRTHITSALTYYSFFLLPWNIIMYTWVFSRRLLLLAAWMNDWWATRRKGECTIEILFNECQLTTLNSPFLVLSIVKLYLPIFQYLSILYSLCTFPCHQHKAILYSFSWRFSRY